MRSKLTAKAGYLWLQVFYMAEVCIISGYAVLFLKSRGLSNTASGAVIASARLLSIFVIDYISRKIDIRKELLNRYLILTASVLCFLHMALFFTASYMLITSVIFASASLLSSLVNSLTVNLYTELRYSGKTINYGLCRGAGSLAYTAVSYSSGIILEKYGTETLLYLGISASALLLMAVLISCRGFVPAENKAVSDAGRNLNVFNYIKDRRGFVLFFAGIILIYMPYISGITYAFNVISGIGGAGKELGIFNAVGALIEVPFMMFFSRTSIKNSRSILSLSVFLMTMKLAALSLAGSMSLVWIGAVLQGISFGLYVPAVVNYINSVTSYSNSAKGQAVASIASSVGAVGGMLITGRLLDLMPVKTALMIMTAVSVTGMILLWAGVHRIRKEE